jgi:uncharacterized membrane protein
MPEVTSRLCIPAPLERVYALARDIEGLAPYIADVESIRVREREGPRTVTEWVGVIREYGRKIKWTEEDHWDDVSHICRFAQLQGDFTEYRGTWSFRDADGATEVEIVLHYEYPIPLIGPLIQKLLLKKVQASCDNILQGLQERALQSLEKKE